MFLKPFKIRTQTSIKGSDRKKLRNEISQQYPGLADEALREMVPNKDDMSIMKITSHAGDSMVVYCLQKNPIFFTNELDRVVLPTVYTLWKHPDLLSLTFTTWPPVFSKMAKGADLMLPGVIVTGDLTPRSLGTFPKGQPCGVKLLGNKSPVAVGITALSAEDMYYSAMRGKGVINVHTFQDHLWAVGDKSSPPEIPDTEMLDTMAGKGTQEETQLETMVETQPETMEETQEEGEERIGEMVHEATTGLDELSVHTADDVEGKEEDNEEEEEELNGAEGGDNISPQAHMDQLLETCFLCAIKSKVTKSDLPLLTSKFFKINMQPCCPPNESLDVKKSSYKKLSKFLAAMKQRGYIALKEQPKGVENITAVHKDHPDIRSFKLPELPPANELPVNGGDSQSSGAGFAPPLITEMYTLTSAAMSLFKHYGYSKGAAVTAVDVRHVLTEYVKQQQLDTQYRGSVTLDPLLSDLLQSKSEYHERFSWEEAFSRCLSKLSPAYRLQIAGQDAIVKKGKLEPISLSVATRSGSKKVTLIHNLEIYGIDAEEVAHTIQKGVACSTSVSPLPGKNRGQEVLVQGNQINYIAGLLTDKYQLPKKYIKGLEKAPKGKKKK